MEKCAERSRVEEGREDDVAAMKGRERSRVLNVGAWVERLSMMRVE
jgi:hypothetical protein